MTTITVSMSISIYPTYNATQNPNHDLGIINESLLQTRGDEEAYRWKLRENWLLRVRIGRVVHLPVSGFIFTVVSIAQRLVLRLLFMIGAVVRARRIVQVEEIYKGRKVLKRNIL